MHLRVSKFAVALEVRNHSSRAPDFNKNSLAPSIWTDPDHEIRRTDITQIDGSLTIPIT